MFTSADLAPVREAEALPAPGDRAWSVAPAGEDDCPLEPVMRKQLARIVLEHEWSRADETSRRVAHVTCGSRRCSTSLRTQPDGQGAYEGGLSTAQCAGGRGVVRPLPAGLPRRLLAGHFGVASRREFSPASVNCEVSLASTRDWGSCLVDRILLYRSRRSC